MRVVEYEPSRRSDVAELMKRVWGERSDERELEWLYERNPVQPALVLLAEEDDRVVGSVAISFVRMCLGGEEVKAGMPIHLATDPDYRGRGIFARLEAENEERARDAGAQALFVVPTPASASVLRGRLGWGDLPSVRVWARPRLSLPRKHLRASRVARFDRQVTSCYKEGPGDWVLRDSDWLNWRFADGPRRYGLLEGDGYAVVGHRGRLGVAAAVCGDLLPDAAAAAEGPALIAAPPPWERGRYARAGFVPTPRTFSLLGKSLGGALPERPHFELGDLDFF